MLKIITAKKLLIFIVAMFVLVLAACDTQPATNITDTSATLNWNGGCQQNRGDWDHGYLWFELRNVNAGGSFNQVGASRRFDCAQYQADGPGTPENVAGLSQATNYQFRLGVRFDNGEYATYDADGTKNGGNYDSFATDSLRSDSGASTVKNNGASSSVDSGKCRIFHITHWGYASNDSPWSRGVMDCRDIPRSIHTNCIVFLKDNTGSGETSQYSPAEPYCSTKAGAGLPDSRYATNSKATLIAVLNDPARKWTGIAPWCSQDRLPDNRARLTCVSTHG